MYRRRPYKRKPDAYYIDGGANDEGYYTAYCQVERLSTYHENGECTSCWNKKVAKLHPPR